MASANGRDAAKNEARTVIVWTQMITTTSRSRRGHRVSVYAVLAFSSNPNRWPELEVHLWRCIWTQCGTLRLTPGSPTAPNANVLPSPAGGTNADMETRPAAVGA
jgi:hypothetical protein